MARASSASGAGAKEWGDHRPPVDAPPAGDHAGAAASCALPISRDPPMDNPMTLEDTLRPLLDAQRTRAEIFEPDDSYWYHRPQIDFPPKSVRDPADDGGPRLSLVVTQTDLPAAKQKALVREWCGLLPTLAGVRTLWFHSRVTQE